MTDIDNWIIQNSKKISLEIEELSWVKRYFAEMTDISAKICSNGSVFEGRGNSLDKNIALRKAIAESFERAICLTELPTTNGVAAHVELKLAQKFALFELIERDCFLSHFFTKTPFLPTNGLFKINKEVEKLLKSQNARINFYLMCPTNLGQGVIANISNGSSWGCILGMAFGTSNRQTAEKAFFEAFRQFFHLCHTKGFGAAISQEEFFRKGQWEFNDHLLLSLNLEYFFEINDLFPTKAEVDSVSMINYDCGEFSYKKFANDKCGFEGLPLFVVKCFGKYCQNLTPGPTNEAMINYEGLSRFSKGAKIKINSIPHPFN